MATVLYHPIPMIPYTTLPNPIDKDGIGWDRDAACYQNLETKDGIWDMGYGIWDMGYGIWDWDGDGDGRLLYANP